MTDEKEAIDLERQKLEGTVEFKATCTCGVSESFISYGEFFGRGWEGVALGVAGLTREQALEVLDAYYDKEGG